MKLSILIPTISQRTKMLVRLKDQLFKQILSYAADIQVIFDESETDIIGFKRNRLLEKAIGDYICFIDDDDDVSPKYIDLLMKAFEINCDCASLRGEYSVNGKFDGIFEHSIKYKEWKTTTNKIKYERYPNHLNMIRSSIAKQFKFPEINHGEDADWSTQIFKSGLLKTEFYIPEIIYYYRKVTNHAILTK